MVVAKVEATALRARGRALTSVASSVPDHDHDQQRRTQTRGSCDFLLRILEIVFDQE